MYSALHYGGPEYHAKLRSGQIHPMEAVDTTTYGRVTFWIYRGAIATTSQVFVYAQTVSGNDIKDAQHIHSVVVYQTTNEASGSGEWSYHEAVFCINGDGYLIFDAQHFDRYSLVGLDEVTAEHVLGKPSFFRDKDAVVKVFFMPFDGYGHRSCIHLKRVVAGNGL